MAIAAIMVNPTPYDVTIEYKAGVNIKLPADGSAELSMEQLDDFRAGKPGSEETRKLMNFEGVYLHDTDLSYDYQALAALKATVAEKTRRIKDFIERTKTSRVRAGHTIDDETMKEVFESAGYDRMQAKVDKMKIRIKALEKVVNTDERKGTVRQTLDPARTCLGTNPPREFLSVTALNMFLDEHPDIKKQHKAMTKPASKKVAEVPDVNPAV